MTDNYKKTMAQKPEQEKNKKNKTTGMSRGRKILSLFQLALLLAIVVGIPAILYFRNPEIIENFRSLEKFNEWIAQYKSVGILIYIVCQIVQIVISVLPGQVIQIAGGYLFGFLTTFLISIIGAAAGTLITFYLAKLLGRNAIILICGEERFHKYQRIMSTQRARKVIFLIYLIPGLPKDLMAYAAGVSGINAFEFILLSLAGRIPAMTVSILFGVSLYSDNYLSAVLIAAAMAVILLICFIKRKKLTAFIEKAETKTNELYRAKTGRSLMDIEADETDGRKEDDRTEEAAEAENAGKDADVRS